MENTVPKPFRNINQTNPRISCHVSMTIDYRLLLSNHLQTVSPSRKTPFIQLLWSLAFLLFFRENAQVHYDGYINMSMDLVKIGDLYPTWFLKWVVQTTTIYIFVLGSGEFCSILPHSFLFVKSLFLGNYVWSFLHQIQEIQETGDPWNLVS